MAELTRTDTGELFDGASGSRGTGLAAGKSRSVTCGQTQGVVLFALVDGKVKALWHKGT